MKKTVIFAISALLLCGGLFCLHLTAQTARNSSSPEDKLRKLEECSERELLELKVVAHRRVVEMVTAHFEAASQKGRYYRLQESKADLAAAEIELYRHTGEQDKLRTAWKSRIEALFARVEAVSAAYAAETLELGDVSEAEIQLIDALLEQKREK